jgi:anti-anti-sigma regulatory factor
MVVKVRGEVDVAFGPDIESAVLAVCETTDDVLLDWSEVSFADSTIIDVSRNCQRMLADRSATLRLAPPSAHPDIFDLTHTKSEFSWAEPASAARTR